MFHPIIAPYRIDMVNELVAHFDMTLCLWANNLRNQTFDIETLYAERLSISPEYLQNKLFNGKPDIIKSVADAIITHKPDVVLVNEFNSVVWYVLFFRWMHCLQYKVISLVDDSMDMIENESPLTNKHALARMLTMPHLDDVVIVNKRVQEWYSHHYSKGIFFPIVSDDVIYRNRLQKILPISDEYVKRYRLQGKKVLLFVGRLYKDKNLPMAIDAFLQAHISDCIFIIIGDGQEKELLTTLYGKESSVLILGRYEGDELYAWYNVAQMLILPSIREPFGAVVNEALMAGCRVLLSEAAGSECLIKDGVNGYMISPGNCESMCQKIIRMSNEIQPLEVPLRVKDDKMLHTFDFYKSELINAINSI